MPIVQLTKLLLNNDKMTEKLKNNTIQILYDFETELS